MRPRKVATSIPKGVYCYDENGVCPHWSMRADKPEQENGYCSHLKKGDWEFTKYHSLLWDQVKECGIDQWDEELEAQIEEAREKLKQGHKSPIKIKRSK